MAGGSMETVKSPGSSGVCNNVASVQADFLSTNNFLSTRKYFPNKMYNLLTATNMFFAEQPISYIINETKLLGYF